MGFWLNLNAQVRPGHRRAAVGSQTPSRYRKFTNISRKYHFVGVPSPIQQSVKIWHERRDEYRIIRQRIHRAGASGRGSVLTTTASAVAPPPPSVVPAPPVTEAHR
jgi:hypothetical protein